MDAEAIVRSGRAGLWARAERSLRARLQAEPDSLPLLESLANLQRQRGDHEAAARAFAELARRAPGHPCAASLASLLGGDGSRRLAGGAGTWPVPFHRSPGFLPSAERARLSSLLQDRIAQFQPLKVYTPLADGTLQGELDRGERHQLGLKDPLLGEVLGPPVVALLETLADPLGLPREDVFALQATAVLSGDGHFSRAHRDDQALVHGHYVSRHPEDVVTAVYYLHRSPRRFEGGDLLLFDTDPFARRFDATRFTLVEPADNSLVVFPSWAYHQIVTVRCASPDPLDGRLAIPIHVSRRARA